MWHGGEAAASQAAYRGMSASDKAQYQAAIAVCARRNSPGLMPNCFLNA